MSVILCSFSCVSSTNHATNTFLPLRSIFYQHFKPLNIDQRKSDRLLDDVACGLRVPRPLIHVLAASKGLIFGDVTLYQHQGKFDIPEGTSIEQIMTGWWTPKDWKKNDIRVINCRSVSVFFGDEFRVLIQPSPSLPLSLIHPRGNMCRTRCVRLWT